MLVYLQSRLLRTRVYGDGRAQGVHELHRSRQAADALNTGNVEPLLEVLIRAGESVQVRDDFNRERRDCRREQTPYPGFADADQFRFPLTTRLEESQCGHDVLNSFRIITSVIGQKVFVEL